MAHFVHPLVKEPVHRLPGRFFDGDAKLRRFNRLVRVFRQIVIDRAPPIVFAQKRAQHMQHRAPARICVSVKDRIGTGVVLRHDGTPQPARPRCVILILIRLHIRIQKVVVAQVMLIPHGLEIGRETFVEPDI